MSANGSENAKRDRTKKRPRRRSHRYLPHLEPLEDRLLPSSAPYVVADINPGSTSQNFHWLTNVSGTLFFAGNDGVHGWELWRSNGTAAGTALVADVNPGFGACSPANINGTLFLSASDGTHGYQLWRSNGTAAGTTMVADINPSGNSFPTYLTNVNGTLFFGADDGVHGYALWRSNGTAAGTTMVADTRQGVIYAWGPDDLTNVEGTLFFAANGELWRSNGTPAGTIVVADGSDIGLSLGGDFAFPAFANVNGTLFISSSDGFFSFELWRSDGTAAGTIKVVDVSGGSAGGGPYQLANVSGTLFFTAADGEQRSSDLCRSDGTAAGTSVVAKIYVDETPGSTSFRRFDLGFQTAFANVRGTLFFAGNDSTYGIEPDLRHGNELWCSDGTASGTSMVADINPGVVGSYPTYLTNVNGTLFFQANDGTHGYELWASP